MANFYQYLKFQQRKTEYEDLYKIASYFADEVSSTQINWCQDCVNEKCKIGIIKFLETPAPLAQIWFGSPFYLHSLYFRLTHLIFN